MSAPTAEALTPTDGPDLMRMAHAALHRSCISHRTMEPEVARAIALGYLELATLPARAWHDPWPEVPGCVVADDPLSNGEGGDR